MSKRKTECVYHFVGIGGIGMSALADILLQKQERVSGSDLSLNPLVLKLQAKGAKTFEGHDSAHIDEKMHLIVSSDIALSNPEVKEAKRLSLPIWHRSDLLNALTLEKKPLCVTGTHGKTTTTALLAHLLKECGLDPSYVVGGLAPTLTTNGYSGKGDYFILEADESDGSFLKTKPYGAIITNLEADHLNYWGSLENLKKGFLQFAALCKGSKERLVWCDEDPALSSLSLPGMSYGRKTSAGMQIEQKGDNAFTLTCHRDFFSLKKGEMFTFQTSLLGLHNVLNAAAALTLSLSLGICKEKLAKALMAFKGVARRLEYIKTENGVDYYDDYAHHPTEIRATLAALKERKRVIVVFQPHRFSRVRSLLKEFQEVLNAIPILVLLPIYGAGEKIDETLFEELTSHLYKEEFYIKQKEEVIPFLRGYAKEGDTVITLGAGDVTKLGRSLG